MGWKPTMGLFLVQPDTSWLFICPSMIQIPRSLAVTGLVPFLGCRLGPFSPAPVAFSRKLAELPMEDKEILI